MGTETRTYRHVDLEWSLFTEMSKDCLSCVLLMSYGVWIGGMKFSFPMERLAFLHEGGVWNK